MEIKFEGGWKIRTFDSRNIIVEKGEIIDGYFPNLESALVDLLDQKILMSDKKNIQELLDLIRSIKKEILEKLEQRK